MKRSPALLALAMACALPLSAAETVRHFGQELELKGAAKVAVDLPVGEVTITGWDQRKVGLDLLLKCNRSSDRCVGAAKAVRFVYRVEGGALRLEFKNWPKFGGKGLHVEARVSVPRDLPLHASLGVGELNISGMEADVDGDLGVGEIDAKLPLAAFGQAHLDTGIGESSLIAGDYRIEKAGLIAREIDWNEGTGRAAVRLDCGVGEIDLTLR